MTRTWWHPHPSPTDVQDKQLECLQAWNSNLHSKFLNSSIIKIRQLHLTWTPTYAGKWPHQPTFPNPSQGQRRNLKPCKRFHHSPRGRTSLTWRAKMKPLLPQQIRRPSFLPARWTLPHMAQIQSFWIPVLGSLPGLGIVKGSSDTLLSPENLWSYSLPLS